MIRSGAALGSTAVQPVSGKGLFSGNYSDLSGKPTIPDKTSQLTNDSNFITNSYHDSTKQDKLVSGTSIKTVNGNSLLGSGNITIQGGGGGGDVNVIEAIKVNGTPQAVTDKTVDISVPTKVGDLTNDSGFITNAYHDSTKQDTISDLATIRAGAVLGATAVQPIAGKGLFSGSYNDLTSKPTIPANTSDLNNDSGFITSSYHDSSKQDSLVSGTNVKTINNNSILGSGNITIATGQNNVIESIKVNNVAQTITSKAVNITVPTKVSDLTNDSNFVTNSYHDSSKQDTLVSGTNIKTVNNQSLLGNGNITIQSGGVQSDDVTNIVVSSTDIGTGATLTNGTLYLVYEE